MSSYLDEIKDVNFPKYHLDNIIKNDSQIDAHKILSKRINPEEETDTQIKFED